MIKWLKRSRQASIKGTKIRYTSEATPPTIVANQMAGTSSPPTTGIEVEVEIVPLEQVLAKATQDVQGQLGTYDLYYLDQSWIGDLRQDIVDPRAYYKTKQGTRDAGLRLGRLLQAAGRRHRDVQRQAVRHPLRHPDLHPDVPQGPVRQAQIKVPTTMDEYMAAVKALDEAEKANGIYGTACQAKSGHYSLECDWTLAVGPWRLDLRQGQEVRRQ